MAQRSLGVLTLDLIAKIGGFTSGMTEAERQADKSQRAIAAAARKNAKQTADEWAAATKLIVAGFAGISIAGLFAKFTKETIDAQNEQTQLAAVLKSTGEAAGFSQRQLNDMAEAMSAIIPDFGAISQAQTVLLKYTNVVGDQFVKALELAGDMAARTGEDIKTSADTIGKALNSPAEGLARLRKFGVDFSDSQRDGLQVLVDTGRAVEAQSIILKELERSYGGAAKAARETFAGSLIALREAMNDLLTGDDDSVAAMREGVESLVTLLKSQEFKEGFANLTSALATIIELTAKVVSGVINTARVVAENLAQTFNGSADPIDRLNENIKSLQDNIASLQKGIEGRSPNLDWVKESQQRIDEFNKELKLALNLRAQLVREAFQPTPRATTSTPTGLSKAELEELAARKKAQEEARKEGEAALKAADAYIRRLQDQLGKVQELTEVEIVLRDIQDGRLKGPRKDEALNLALQIDYLKQQAEQFKQLEKDLDEQVKLYEKLAEARKKGQDFAQDIIVSQDPVAALLRQLEERKRLLAEYAAADEENQALYANAAVILEQQTQERITKVLQDAAAQREALRKAEQDKYLNAATTFFGNLEQLQSSSSDRLARIGRAAAIANAIVKTYEAANSAYASLAGIPIVGPVLGAAAAAAAIAAGLANVQAIRSQGNRAGGGAVSAGNAYEVGELGREMFVPQQSGFIVPNQLLNDKGGVGGAQVNQRIVNVLDPAMVGDFLATPAGEQVLVNVIRRNSDSLRAVVSNG